MEPTFRYSLAQRLLHWAMALVIFIAIGLGVYAATLKAGTPLRVALLNPHKSLGMLALCLLLARMFVRLLRGEPPWRVPLAPALRRAAHLAHGALYALMLAMPVSGYLLSAAGGYPLPFFGLFEWPRLVEKSRDLNHMADSAHYWFAWALGALLLAHVAAALWHHFIKKDETLSRMR